MKHASETNHALSRLMGAAALGAVTMYLMDPDKGRRRRALARDKIQSVWTRTDNAIAVSARDLGNRMRGLRARAGSMLPQRKDEVLDDRLLVERVRSKIGRVVSHPHAIKVTAQQGCVILSGAVLADEKEQLLAVTRKTPGVASIDDVLEVHERRDVPSLQGEGKRRLLRPAMLHENWPPALRTTMALGGGMLGYYGLTHRSPAGAMLAALGLGLIARGATNRPFTRMLGADAEAQRVQLERTIHIAAPPDSVYGVWANYENFPRFMSNVESVRDLGNGRSHWVVNGPAGMRVEWDAVLTECTSPELLAWKTEPGSTVQHAGRVRFEPANGGTRVQVQMSYSPPAGALGQAVASLFNGDPKKQLDEDLSHMKAFIEGGIPGREAARTQPQVHPTLQ